MRGTPYISHFMLGAVDLKFLELPIYLGYMFHLSFIANYEVFVHPHPFITRGGFHGDCTLPCSFWLDSSPFVP
jgi:hypothetical protein